MATLALRVRSLLKLTLLEEWEKRHNPLFLQITPGLIEEAREWAITQFGRKRAAELTGRKVVELYVALPPAS